MTMWKVPFVDIIVERAIGDGAVDEQWNKAEAQNDGNRTVR